ncbi:ABC transporter permease [Gallibacterium salpingitidis]|uniref:ABC transporter permease n=1 Tax=Gallibacterium salpingitidis TaxID=505341 RepID=UPI0018D29460|nr:iron ABC transporter permease [Gallibacterium salpingitidis]
MLRVQKLIINVVTLILIGFFLMPIVAIFYQAVQGSLQSLTHLWHTVLADYVINSLLLVSGTVVISLCFALPAAYLVSRYQFKTQAILQWLLCLPLAIPAYLSAYLYTDFLDYPGVVQQWLRMIFGWQSINDYWFPSIRSLGGACFILALSLYPYIFLLSRMALMEQSENLIQSAKLLGASPRQIFWRVTLPLLRPSIAVGCALVAMEALGDFGTVFYFAIPTLTTAVYDTWLGFGDLQAAAQIAIAMLALISFFIGIERYARRKQKLYQRGCESQHQYQTVTKWWEKGLVIYSWLLVTLAFLVPLLQLGYWAYHYFAEAWTKAFFDYAKNSLTVATIASLVSVILALILHFIARLFQYPLAKRGLRLGSLGYAVPGTVLAIGLLIPLTFADHQLHRLTTWLDISSFGLIFSGSIFALIVAYVIRFSAMSLGSIETTLNKIPPSFEMAGRTLGHSNFSIWRKIHLPLLRKGILTALLLVFIESMKELNASLLLRPFNFDTLATHVFTYTSDEQLERAALPAIVLIVVGLIPVIILTRSLLANKK